MPGTDDPRAVQPISRLRFLLGSAAIMGYHGLAGAALESTALLDPGFKPVARFHRAFLADLARALARRDGITLRAHTRRAQRDA